VELTKVPLDWTTKIYGLKIKIKRKDIKNKSKGINFFKERRGKNVTFNGKRETS